MVGLNFGLIYSYSVFFKPLADSFNWDRATVSLVFSASLIFRGAISIFIGWLADHYGARKMMVFCGFMIGLGLVLSSQVHSLWQLFLTYGVVEAIGLSGAFCIGTSVISRWFTNNRGLALGMVSAGSGLGIVFIIPGNERLISLVGWSDAFRISGAIGGVIIMIAALFLRMPSTPPPASGPSAGDKANGGEFTPSRLRRA